MRGSVNSALRQAHSRIAKLLSEFCNLLSHMVQTQETEACCVLQRGWRSTLARSTAQNEARARETLAQLMLVWQAKAARLHAIPPPARSVRCRLTSVSAKNIMLSVNSCERQMASKLRAAKQAFEEGIWAHAARIHAERKRDRSAARIQASTIERVASPPERQHVRLAQRSAAWKVFEN